MKKSALDSSQNVDRRSAIKKALAAGGVGYVAPMVLGPATPASAQVSGGCTVSDTCATFSCGGGNCACVPMAGGGLACVTPTCTGIVCTTNADCAAGSVCFTLGCCGAGNFCVPLCGGGGARQGWSS